MWEYLILELEHLIPTGNLKELPKRLNNLGKERWELIGNRKIGFTHGVELWIFKRTLKIEVEINNENKEIKKICNNCIFFKCEDDYSGPCNKNDYYTNRDASCKEFKPYISGDKLNA